MEMSDMRVLNGKRKKKTEKEDKIKKEEQVFMKKQ